MARRKKFSELDGLSLGFLEAHPQEAADVLERLSTADAAAALSVIPARIAAPVLAAMLPLQAAHCLLALPDDVAITLLQTLSAQNIAAILRHMTKTYRQNTLAQLPTTTAMACRLLLRHPEDSVGAIVDSNAYAAVGSATVKETLARLRERRDSHTDYVYVIDAQRCVAGAVSLLQLLRAATHNTLQDIQIMQLPTLSVQATLTAAQSHPGWNAYHVLPVVERDRRFIGSLRYADLHRYLQQNNLLVDAKTNLEDSIAVLGLGYWRLFDGLLQGVVDALPPARNQAVAEESSGT